MKRTHLLHLGRATLLAAAATFALAVPTSARAATGAQLWAQKCAMCHGKDGKGNTGMGKRQKIANFTTAKFQKSVTDAQIESTIKTGVNRTKDGVKQRMFPARGLSAAQITSLVKYVRSLKK